MIKITWHSGEPPASMAVRQVYAIAFNEDEKVFLRYDTKNKLYGMFGGTPEKYDSDRIATLKREFLDEANTTLKEPIYLVGYQVIEGDGEIPNYVQLRMVALIDRIGEKKPDHDNGEIYERVFASPEKAIKLLNWRDTGEKQIREAYKILNEKFGIVTTNFETESV